MEPDGERPAVTPAEQAAQIAASMAPGGPVFERPEREDMETPAPMVGEEAPAERAAAIAAQMGAGGVPQPAAEPEGTSGPLAVVDQLGKQIVKGAASSGEFFADLYDVSALPLAKSAIESLFRKAGLTTGGEPVGETFAEHPLRQAIAAMPSPVAGSFMGALTKETASDRLRAGAAEASGLPSVLKRTLVPGGGYPGAKGDLVESLSSGAHIAGGSVGPGGVLRQAVTAAGAGAGTTAASFIARQMGAGDTARIITEVVGGLVGALSPGTVKTIAKRVDDYRNAPPGSDAVMERQALQDIRAVIAEDVGEDAADKVIQQIRDKRAAGREGTLSMVTEDDKLRALETQVSARNAEARGAVETARDKAVEQRLADMRGAAPEAAVPARAIDLQTDVADAARQQAEETAELGIGVSEAAADQARTVQASVLKQAVGQADEVKAGLQAAPDVEASGATIAGAADELLAARVAAERAAWKEVPQSITVDTGPLMSGLRGVAREGQETLAVPPAVKKAINEFERAAQKQGNTQPVRELIALKNNITDAFKTAKAQGQTISNAERLTANYASVVDEAIKAVPDTSPAFTAAKNATIKRTEGFQKTPLGRAMRAADKAPPTIGGKLIPATEAGGTQVRGALGAGLPKEQIEAALLAQYTKQAYRGNTFNPAGATNFFDGRKAALKEFPELTTRLRADAAAANRGLAAEKAAPKTESAITRKQQAEATALRETRDKALGDVKESAAAQFSGDNAGLAAADVLKNPRTSMTKTKELAANARKGTPQDLEDLQSAYIEGAMYDLASIKGAGTKALPEIEVRFKLLKPVLTEVLEPGQIKSLETNIDAIVRLSKGQELTEHMLRTIGDSKLERGMVAVARIVGAKVGGVVSGQPLLASNMASQYVRRYLQDIPQAKYEALMAKFLTKPDEFLAATDRLGVRKRTPEEVVSLLSRLFAVSRQTAASVGQAREE